MRQHTFGHRAWNQRRRDKERARVVAGTQNATQPQRKVFHLLPPRDVQTIYRVKRVGRGGVGESELRLKLRVDGNPASPSPPHSYRSGRSWRKQDSGRTRRDSHGSQRRGSRGSHASRPRRMSALDSPGSRLVPFNLSAFANTVCSSVEKESSPACM